ncbi:hypothetical protein PV703_12155 [Streptomyces sp. ME01-24h]|nr:hypothetical protein [Streptomyces sp. ME01-24h]
MKARDFWRERLIPLAQQTVLPTDLPYPQRPAEPAAPHTHTHTHTRSRALPGTDAGQARHLAAYVALLHHYGGGATDLLLAHDGLPLRLALTADPLGLRRRTPHRGGRPGSGADLVPGP